MVLALELSGWPESSQVNSLIVTHVGVEKCAIRMMVVKGVLFLMERAIVSSSESSKILLFSHTLSCTRKKP